MGQDDGKTPERRSKRERRSGRDRRAAQRDALDRRSGQDRRGHPFYAPRETSRQPDPEAEQVTSS